MAPLSDEGGPLERRLIGDLARRVGVTTKAVRYYESLGLLGPAQRSDSGYRVYRSEDEERLRFIVATKALGLSLSQIQEVLHAWSQGESPCTHVSRILDEKLAGLDVQIARLTGFRDDLRAYKAKMDAGKDVPGVPCRHVQGVVSGEWHPASEEPVPPVTSRRKRK